MRRRSWFTPAGESPSPPPHQWRKPPKEFPLSTSRLSDGASSRTIDDRNGYNRLSFAKIAEPLPVEELDLVAIQRESFRWLQEKGLSEVFEEISPIADFTGQLELSRSDEHTSE